MSKRWLVLGWALAGLAYWYIIRPWHIRWGATDEELQRTYPGDELVPNPKHTITHAITINARATDVWPWLAQMGQGRGGFYSYEWIENLLGLNIHNANRIAPELQDIQPGDSLPLGGGVAIPIAIVEPGRALVLHGDTRQAPSDAQEALKAVGDVNLSWGWYLHEEPAGATRLIERWRIDYQDSPVMALTFHPFWEPGAFIMQQKMLRGIKERAEAAVRQGGVAR